jgi:IMP dehydrogenase
VPCKDQFGRLRVGAAVGVGEGTDERVRGAGGCRRRRDRRRYRAWPLAGRARSRASWVKKHFPQLDVIGGNIATAMRPRRWSMPAPMA